MNLPSFASLRPANLTAAAISGVGGQRPPHISIDSNVFTLVDSTGNRKQLPPMITSPGVAAVAIDVVFIDANPKPSKLYWDPAKPFSPQSVDPPLCWSDNGVGPSYLSVQPQSPTCQACPHNVIGSAVSKFSGASIRACGDSKKLACVVPGDADGMVYLMQIKPGSFKNWSSYINWLKSQKLATGGVPELFDVVTRMTFESQGVLKFEPVSAVEENSPLGAQMIEAWSKKITGSMIGLDDRPIDPNQMALTAPVRPLPPPPVQAGAQAPLSPQQWSAQAPVQQWQPQPAAQLGPNGHLGETPQPRTRRTKAQMEAERALKATKHYAENTRPEPAYPAGYNAQNPAAPPTPPFAANLQQARETFSPPSGLQQAPTTGTPVQDPAIPQFLNRTGGGGSALGAVVGPTMGGAPPASSGLATPQTPSDDLKAKLAAAFALPTGK